MNNDLEQFSEERLIELVSDKRICVTSEVRHLASIALSAKRAEPIGEIRLSEYRSDGTRDASVVCLHDQADWDNFTDGTLLYLTPPANYPAVQDGWIKCSERMPDAGQIVVIINAGHGEIYEAATVTRHGPHFLLLDGLEASNYDGGAVVTLGLEATHWMPLPAAPKPEDK